jgi:hypothetical protein
LPRWCACSFVPFLPAVLQLDGGSVLLFHGELCWCVVVGCSAQFVGVRVYHTLGASSTADKAAQDMLSAVGRPAQRISCACRYCVLDCLDCF